MSALRLPDFIIAGAPRSATTWLYQLADRHPEIAMAKPLQPEPKFFLIDELYARGLVHYAATWFDPLPPRRFIGEKTTNYLENRAAAERIYRSLPAVRLIFLLRDPVERAYSNYLWSRRNGFETETFERALSLEAERECNLPQELRYARPFAYFSRGLYAEHLGRYLQFFPRDQLLVLRSEDVAADPESVAIRLQCFLGLDVIPGLTKGLGIFNAAYPGRPPPLSTEQRALLRERYAMPNRQLESLLGPDFEMWAWTDRED